MLPSPSAFSSSLSSSSSSSVKSRTLELTTFSTSTSVWVSPVWISASAGSPLPLSPAAVPLSPSVGLSLPSVDSPSSSSAAVPSASGSAAVPSASVSAGFSAVVVGLLFVCSVCCTPLSPLSSSAIANGVRQLENAILIISKNARTDLFDLFGLFIFLFLSSEIQLLTAPPSPPQQQNEILKNYRNYALKFVI